MKKIISIALVAMMIVACLPLSVFAETNAAQIGDVKYATLDAAVQAANTGDVITLLNDCEMTSAAVRSTGSYTIDGSNRKYTVTLKNKINLNDCDVTFKGVNIVTTTPKVDYERLELTSGKSGDLVLDNSYFKSAHMGIKHCGYGNLTFKNNSLFESTSPDAGFYFRGDHADATEDQCVITVDNSTLRHTAAADNGTNASLMHFNSAAATYKLKLIGNAVLEHASKSTTITTPSIIYAGNGNINGALVIYADPTAKITLSTTASSLTGSYFTRMHTSGGKTFPITLYGTPQFTVSSKVASTGINMPNFTNMYSLDGAITYTKWSNGSEQLTMNQKYVGSATVFTPIAESASNDNKVAYIKNANGEILNYYTSLDTAINAVADGQTIVLLGNVTQSKMGADNISYTIDGQNRAYTITSAATLTSGNRNVTYKGVKLTIPSGKNFLNDIGQTGDFIFDNCYISAENGMTHRGRGNFSFINGTLYEGSSMSSTMLYMRGDNAFGEDEGIITVDNSTIIQQHGGNITQTQNAGIFHCNPRGGANYTFNIKGNSVLKQESTITNAKGACIFYFQLSDYNGYCANTVINADSTAKFILASKSTALTEATFIRTDYTIAKNGKIQENILNGTPQFIASANVVKQGVIMPNVIHNSADGKIRYTNVWSVDGGANTFKGNADALNAYVYKNTSATADTVFTPVDTKYTGANAPIPFGVEKAGKVEYYDSWDQIYYRRTQHEAYVLGRNYDYSVANIFSAHLDTDPYGTVTTTASDGTTTTKYAYDETWTLKGADTGTGAKLNLVVKSNYTSGMSTWQYYDYVGARNITIENLNITFNDNISTDPAKNTGALTFNDCTVNLNNAIRVENNCQLTFNNCKVNSAIGDCVFFIRNAQKNTEAVITVNNTDIIKAGSDDHINHANIFHVLSNTDPKGYDVRIVIKGNSRLENRGTGTTNLHLIHYENSVLDTNKLVLDIQGDDVVFALNPQGESLTNGMFIKVSNNRTVDIIGMPKFEMNALAANSGVKFFGGTSGKYNQPNYGELIGVEYTAADGEKYLFKGDIPAGKVNKDLVAEFKYMTSDNGFDMMDGASIRKKNGSGIRFSSVISNWLYDMTKDHNIEFGTIFASDELRNGATVDMALVASNTVDPIAVYVKSDSTKWIRVDANDATSDVIYRAAIIDIPDEATAYLKRIAGRSVMTITYDDGTTAVFYSDFGNNNIRSMYDVAVKLEDSSEDIVQHIKDTVGTTSTTPLAPETEETGKSIDLYIIAGQSNGAGYTSMNASTLSGLWSNHATGSSNVKYIGRAESTTAEDGNGIRWTSVNESVHWTNAKSGQGRATTCMGAEVGMASYLSANYYNGNKDAGIIKFAHGGTSLFNTLTGENVAGGNWVSPSYAEALGIEYTESATKNVHKGTGGLYLGLLDQVEYSIKMLELQGYTDINIKGVFWMQGEADRSNPAEYERAFKYFVSDLRADLGEITGEDMSNLAIMIGEISRTSGSAVESTITVNETFIAMQRELATEINDTYVIASGQYEINWLEGTTNKNGQDAWHWTTEPMFRIGELVGACIVNDILK